MDELLELIENGYRVLCRAALAPPVPVRKIARGKVVVKEWGEYEYQKIDSDNCIYRLAGGEEECKECPSADECGQWVKESYEDTEELECFALDLGTSGIAGQGYSDEEHWYFSTGYDVDHESRVILFDVPILGGFRYENEDRYLNGYRRVEYTGELGELIADLSEQWQPRKVCGCI